MELISLLLFAHGTPPPPRMLVRLAPLAGCPLKFDSSGQGLWFSDVFPAPPESDREIKSQVAARLYLFWSFAGLARAC